ncbi:hypothetical protein [Geobacillus subterraneus]|uniref:hypothetical protein n=1 Tax=Geobacillus subterraneus TaxID=129338 RepID=UPI001610295D
MSQLLTSLLTGILGGSVTIIFREVLLTKKENNMGLQIAKVVLTNELNKNHDQIVKENSSGKSLKDYILQKEKYMHDKNSFNITAWENSKMEITRLNPTLAKEIFSVYSFYYRLRETSYSSEISEKELNDYLEKYCKLNSVLKASE